PSIPPKSKKKIWRWFVRQKRKLKTQVQKTKTYKDKYKRKNMISLCLNDEEFEKVKLLSEHLNIPRATAIREVLILKSDAVLSKIKKNENKDLALELNKIGNNLNQLTKKINSNIELFLMGDAEMLALSIDDLNKEFNKALKEIL
ncbi:plasmid mobilization relaxosome protein MobC, partial [Providencia rettgeri]